MKNATNSYLVVFDPAEEGGFNVSFPEFPGCVTYGKTLPEAQKMAKEALELWLEEIGDNSQPQAIVKHIAVKQHRTKLVPA